MLWLLACAPESPLVTETQSDEGTWNISLEEGSYLLGENEICMAVTQADTSTESLGLVLHPWMPGMDMGQLPSLDGEHKGEGEYRFLVDFDMTGLWHLDGVISDDMLGSERFSLVVEVL